MSEQKTAEVKLSYTEVNALLHALIAGSSGSSGAQSAWTKLREVRRQMRKDCAEHELYPQLYRSGPEPTIITPKKVILRHELTGTYVQDVIQDCVTLCASEELAYVFSYEEAQMHVRFSRACGIIYEVIPKNDKEV